MTNLIQNQLGIIIVMTYCGLTSGLIYEFFTLFITRFIKKNKIMQIIVRMFGYIVIGMMAADFMMYCQNGKITFTGMVCFVLGLLLWRKFFYGIMNAR